MSTAASLPTPTFAQKLFLVLGVPAILLVVLELGCRMFQPSRLFAGTNEQVLLDMPTWLLREDNSRERMKVNPKSVDWFDLFEEGEGYRVHMTPSVSRFVTNTFSRIDADRSEKYLVKSNALGFRGPDIAPKKTPGTVRVLVFGDSSAFGWGVQQDETYSQLLDGMLERELGRPVEVGNFAMPGDSSEYGRLVAEHFLPKFESDVVVFGFGANDAKKVFTPHRDQVDRFRSRSALIRASDLLGKSELYRTLKAMLISRPHTAKADAVPAKSAVPRKRFRTNLSAMGEFARAGSGALPVLLQVCTPEDYARAAKHTAERHHFAFLDGQRLLLDSLPGLRGGKIHPELVAEMRQRYPQELAQNELYYVTSDGCHPNKAGHRLIAEELAKVIAAALKSSARST